MNIKFEHKDNVLTCYIEGEIDHHTAGDLREKIDGMAHRIRPKRMILDLKGVPFSDSSGIAVVFGRYKLMNSLGGTLEIHNACPIIKKILTLAGTQKYLKVE